MCFPDSVIMIVALFSLEFTSWMHLGFLSDCSDPEIAESRGQPGSSQPWPCGWDSLLCNLWGGTLGIEDKVVTEVRGDPNQPRSCMSTQGAHLPLIGLHAPCRFHNWNFLLLTSVVVWLVLWWADSVSCSWEPKKKVEKDEFLMRLKLVPQAACSRTSPCSHAITSYAVINWYFLCYRRILSVLNGLFQSPCLFWI